MSYPNHHPHSCPWHKAAELVGAPNIKWCEETLCSWISEPANTWSNLAYIFSAFLLHRWFKNHKNLSFRFMAPAMFIMGLFSLLYHMSNNYVSQLMDFLGMLIFLNWLAILSLGRVNFITKKSFKKIYISSIIITMFLVHWMYLYQHEIILSLVLTIIIILLCELYLIRKNRGKFKFFAFGLLFIGLGQLSSLLEAKRIICDPSNHWFQLHALQHVLCGIGLTLTCLHYREK